MGGLHLDSEDERPRHRTFCVSAFTPLADLHIGNVILRDSPVIIDFVFTIRRPGWSDEEWKGVVEGGPDTRNMRRALVDGGWKKNVTPFEMSNSRYDNPAVFNKYVENLPEDHRMKMFESFGYRLGRAEGDGASVEDQIRCSV